MSKDDVFGFWLAFALILLVVLADFLYEGVKCVDLGRSQNKPVSYSLTKGCSIK